MRRRKTHFEQVPIEVVEKILRQQTSQLFVQDSLTTALRLRQLLDEENGRGSPTGRLMALARMSEKSLAANLGASVLSSRGIPKIRGGKYPFKEQL